MTSNSKLAESERRYHSLEEWKQDNVEEWVIDCYWAPTGWHACMEYVTRYYFVLTGDESKTIGQDRTSMLPRRFSIALAMAQSIDTDGEEPGQNQYRLRNVNTGETIPMDLFV